jgi:crotonobetainyl-CoA:carnitine CoA-transferase CaiB-like acyl-CoA transferase
MFHDLPHPRIGPIRVLAPPLALDGDGFQPGAVTAPLGSETRVLLAGLGLGADEIEALLAAGVTREAPPD